MKRALPRGTIAQAVERRELPNVVGECVSELFPLQKEKAEAARAKFTSHKRKPGPKSLAPIIRAAYADKYPEGHGPTPLSKVRDILREHIKSHFQVWTRIDDKTFQRCGL